MGLAITTNRIGSRELNENASFKCKGILQLQDPFVIAQNQQDLFYMECSNKDILFQAAEAWMDLTQYRYIFTYGYKNKLYTIRNINKIVNLQLVCIAMISKQVTLGYSSHAEETCYV